MAKKASRSWTEWFKPILGHLKGEAVKRALVALIGSSAGFKAWVLSFLLDFAFDRVVVPLINLLIDKGQLLYDIQKGRLVVKKYKKAKEDGDAKTYTRIVTSI